MARSNSSLSGTSTSLGAALEAFILEHEYCGEQDSDVESDRVYMWGDDQPRLGRGP